MCASVLNQLSEVQHLQEDKLDIYLLEDVDQIRSFVDELSRWNKTAQILLERANIKRIPEKDRYWDAVKVANILIPKFRNPEIDQFEYLICMDQSGQLQGCMMLSEINGKDVEGNDRLFLEIKYLMSRPQNILSSLLNQAFRVAGVGRALIKTAEEICRNKNLDGLFINPVASAIGFYERVGFVFLPYNRMIKMKNQFEPI